MIIFTVYGEPKGKARPRFSKGHTYTPPDTTDYEKLVARTYKSASNGEYFDKGTAVGMSIIAFYGIPKSASKNQREQMLRDNIGPTKKPDLDNIAKIIMDALNGVAYHDDAQVVNLSVYKHYSTVPGVQIGIYDMNEINDTKEEIEK